MPLIKEFLKKNYIKKFIIKSTDDSGVEYIRIYKTQDLKIFFLEEQCCAT
jgi:hypothetical protein